MLFSGTCDGFIVKPHTSDKWMTYEYIRARYRWHTSTSEWYMDDIRVYTTETRMTYEYIRVTYKWHDMRMTFEWHTNDMCFKRKNKLSFLKLFENSLSKYVICRKNSLHVMAVLGYLIKLKWSLELSFSADFLHGFLVQILLI